MRIVLACIIAFVIFSSMLVMERPADAIGTSAAQTLPSPPKTREQIASEAYTLEADIRSQAGRKTDPTLDGTGGSPTARMQSDTSNADFQAGSNVNLTISDDQMQVQGGNILDDFSGLSLHARWGLVDPGAFTSVASGNWGRLNEVYTAGAPAYIYLKQNLPSDYNASFKVLTNTDGEVVQNICIADTDQQATSGSAISGHERIRVCLKETGSPTFLVNAIKIVYYDGSGTRHYWTGAAWTTSITNFTETAPDTHYYNITISRNVGASQYDVLVNDFTAGTQLTKASIALTSVRNGGSGSFFIMAGDPVIAAWSAENVGSPIIYEVQIDSFYEYPGFSSGSFTSHIFSMSEWDALLTKVSWTQLGSAIDVTARYSNNSDMTNPSGWLSVSNNTDITSENKRGGYWQYSISFTDTTQILYDLTLHYSSQSTGDAPSKDKIGEIRASSVWVHVSYTLAYSQRLDVRTVPQTLNLWINNSLIDFSSYTATPKGFLIADNGPNVPGQVAINVNVANSTIRNVGNITWIERALFNPIEAFTLNLDNVTLSTFNKANTGGGDDLVFYWDTRAASMHDSTITEYNKADLSYSALNFIISIIRVKASNPTARSTGVIANNPLIAKWNLMEGGFNQLSWQGAAVGPGPATEYVNWSYNYVANSTHTALGIHGQNSGTFCGPSLSAGYYFTLYKNYVNNSRYIIIQTSGNMSNLRIIGNYEQGPSASFSEAIGLNWNAHNVTVDSNYIWNMNTTNNRGIVTTGFGYDITYSNNVVYDVGVRHMDFESLGKKSCPSLTSDYSWRGMNIVSRNNWLEGAWFGGANSRYWWQDSGYIISRNDTFVSSMTNQKAIYVYDSWAGPGYSYVQTDIFDPIGLRPTDSTVGVQVGSCASGNICAVDGYTTTTFEASDDGAILDYVRIGTSEAITSVAVPSGTIASRYLMEWRISIVGYVGQLYSATLAAPAGLRVLSIQNRASSPPQVVWEGSSRQAAFTAAAGSQYYSTFAPLTGEPYSKPVLIAGRDVGTFALMVGAAVAIAVVIGMAVRRDGP